MTHRPEQGASITVHPAGRQVEVQPGQSLLEALRDHGSHVSSVCGGQGTCGKCRVLIQGPVDEPLAVERVHLSEGDLDRGVRLACQTRPKPGQLVKVLRAEGGQTRILKGGKTRKVVLSPSVRKLHVAVPAAGIDGATDWERVAGNLKSETIEPRLAPLRQLPAALRDKSDGVTLVLQGNCLTAIEPGDTTGQLYGMAFDIGTTTVVGYLLDLKSGRELASPSALNPQGTYGEDLMSRMGFVQERPDGLAVLRGAIVSLLNRLIEEAVESAGIDRSQIYEVTLVGNVVMHHLVLGIDTRGLAIAPYAPVVRDGLDIPASEIGLDLGPQALAHVLPNIAGFVGADMVGTLLTTLPHQSSNAQLIIDLGTNGEIAMGSRERLLVCSTAAGPAFEGARISCGMRAASGAIDRVRMDGDLHCHVVDGGPPAGICGSGLVDAVAHMLDHGIISASGRLLRNENAPPCLGPRLRARLKGSGQPGDDLRFILSPHDGPEDVPEVSITQQDIRELQLAKGAIYAGIQVLKKELGIEDEDLSNVVLAGAFGTFVSAESARRIGLIPPLPLDRIKAVGNAAGFGAQLALLSTKEREIAGLIARQSEHVRLSGRPDFQDLFVRSLNFPGEGSFIAEDRGVPHR